MMVVRLSNQTKKLNSFGNSTEDMSQIPFRDISNKEDYSMSMESESIFDKYRLGKAPLHAPFRLFETNSNTSCDQESFNSEKNDRRIRGPYRKYTLQEKMETVDRILAGEDVKLISRESGIPRRNLLRWKKNGCERKQGGGRPTDNQMEELIFTKIKQGILTDEKAIRRYAIELSKTNSFKASKGWFVKFCHRYDLVFPNCSQDKENIVEQYSFSSL